MSVKVDCGYVKEVVERNLHKIMNDDKLKEIGETSMIETMKSEAKKKKRLEQLSQFDRLKLQKEYNEKVANMIMGTGNVPRVVGRTSEPNMNLSALIK